MFKILQKTLNTGIVTTAFPAKPATVSSYTRGRPDFDLRAWRDARPAAEICPTGAIRVEDSDGRRQVTVDYGRCVFCGQCAEASDDGAIRITKEFELATRDRQELIITAQYTLHEDGTHR